MIYAPEPVPTLHKALPKLQTFRLNIQRYLQLPEGCQASTAHNDFWYFGGLHKCETRTTSQELVFEKMSTRNLSDSPILSLDAKDVGLSAGGFGSQDSTSRLNRESSWATHPWSFQRQPRESRELIWVSFASLVSLQKEYLKSKRQISKPFDSDGP